jgi:hypothetical protein
MMSLFTKMGLRSASQNNSLLFQIKVWFAIDDHAQTNHNKNTTNLDLSKTQNLKKIQIDSRESGSN